jgi:alkanesulfonate monooxygenase SsuD/methylene tetrahydromethanopterin reductase-like flavin-dependent oxidoreductase (luciferase family)
VDFAQVLDTLGYDEFWMAEHHFQPEGYECIPNLLMLNVYLATKTARLKFGCGFNITPMWHPLRLAEDFAMADILTGGRVIFGVGRGYHTREVETFGAPILDSNANRARHWFRLMSDPHGGFCWTRRPCSVLLLRSGLAWP